ncbi:hypothetical protein BGZ95_004658 [Linnemannia exigua]|uniref:T-box domain-containing protein n=1 Tax=Linnemannia exigua TaxID=604196 RepID=A0AAD4DHN5_9FUNG|nr:hypothetical protein BGZ95_004658 [Linnemannia exigua]
MSTRQKYIHKETESTSRKPQGDPQPNYRLSKVGYQPTESVLSSSPFKNPLPRHPPTSTKQLCSSSSNGPYNGTPPVLLLLEADLWKKFHDEHNEMIVTKSGRCLFPTLKFEAINLDPDAYYSVQLDFEMVSPNRFRFSDGSWKPAMPQKHAGIGLQDSAGPIGANPAAAGEYYTHPDRFQLGSHWMANSISFTKAKLSNKVEPQRSIAKRAGKSKADSGNMPSGDDSDVPQGSTDLEGANRIDTNIFHMTSFHKYRPRLRFIQRDKCSDTILESTTHHFERAEFIAVTHYQNDNVNDLKKAHNPHAKGFSEMTMKVSPPVEIPVARHQQEQKYPAPESQPSITTHFPRPGKRLRTSGQSDGIGSDDETDVDDHGLDSGDTVILVVADVGTRSAHWNGRSKKRARLEAMSAVSIPSSTARVPLQDKVSTITPPLTLTWYQKFLWDLKTTKVAQDILPIAPVTGSAVPSDVDKSGLPFSFQLETVDSVATGAAHSTQIPHFMITSPALNPCGFGSHGGKSASSAGVGTRNGGVQRDSRMMLTTILESKPSVSTSSIPSATLSSGQRFSHQARLDRVHHENRLLRAYIRDRYGLEAEAEADAAMVLEQLHH